MDAISTSFIDGAKWLQKKTKKSHFTIENPIYLWYDRNRLKMEV